MNILELISGHATLPASWKLVPIGEAYEFTKKPRSLRIQDETLIPFIRMEEIPLNRTYLDSISQYKKGGEISSGTYFEDGDLLVAKITPSFENGKQAISNIKKDYGFATTEVIPIKEIKGKSNILYLFFLLKNQDFRSFLAGKMEGTTGRQRLNKTALFDQLIPLPPIEQQRKIVRILTIMQKSIDLHEEMAEKVVEMKQSTINQLMTGEISVTSFEVSTSDIAS